MDIFGENYNNRCNCIKHLLVMHIAYLYAGITLIAAVIITITQIIDDLSDSYKYWGKLYLHEVPFFRIIVDICLLIFALLFFIKV